MSLKINKLEIENVKRVKAVRIHPTENGLTIIGGDNNQGKTSVLDAIAWALGGNKYKPSEPQRKDSTLPPSLKLVMSNGLIVERKGKNSDLKVTDPSGGKAGQQLLDSFVSQFALDLPKFMESTSKEKANTLLQVIGVGQKLFEIEQREKELYNQRHAMGVVADQKVKYAKEQPYYTDAPKEPVSISDLIQQQQEILARNGENQKKRRNLEFIKSQADNIRQVILDLERKLQEAKAREADILSDMDIATKSALDLHDESTEELEKSIRNVEEINRKVRANLDKEKAEDDAKEYQEKYDKLSLELSKVRTEKSLLLENSNLPLPGLTVVEGELLYNGYMWDGMSGSDQLKVATAIVRKLNPDCGFVLLDKLEQMDVKTLKEFGAWLESEGLQAIATRVSRGEECQIIIEDGYNIKDDTPYETEPVANEVTTAPVWEPGKF
ncbi:MAG TPA: chromosome segregation protein SMC [Proteiniclasticum sp.]|uniref:AAA family ATPase n=1 Tax=Proteiniclasticum sp. TaxID=2053595 RepID=UPI000E9DECFF|nr:AAA family ATPase [Proteiniclasticum sp.]HBW13811.1 chromosome segregation protein SMC [Proteiniclasticum sp.]